MRVLSSLQRFSPSSPERCSDAARAYFRPACVSEVTGSFKRHLGPAVLGPVAGQTRSFAEPLSQTGRLRSAGACSVSERPAAVTQPAGRTRSSEGLLDSGGPLPSRHVIVGLPRRHVIVALSVTGLVTGLCPNDLIFSGVIFDALSFGKWLQR